VLLDGRNLSTLVAVHGSGCVWHRVERFCGATATAAI